MFKIISNFFTYKEPVNEELEFGLLEGSSEPGKEANASGNGPGGASQHRGKFHNVKDGHSR